MKKYKVTTYVECRHDMIVDADTAHKAMRKCKDILKEEYKDKNHSEMDISSQWAEGV